MPSPGPGEVLVRVAACGVCHTDLHVLKGEVAFPLPAVLGHEISGTVVELGAGLDGPAPGTPVLASFIMPCGTCEFCAAGRDDLCARFFSMNRLRGTLYDGASRLRFDDGTPISMYSMGGLADHAVVPATDIFPLPEGLPLEDAAVLGCATFTAYGAARHGADLRCGERVAIVAAGGVGSSLIQVARAFGAAQIVVVDVSRAKLEAALRLGATAVVDASAEDAVARVRELTGGAGADAAFEALGRPETFVQALGMVRDGGRMVAVGIAPAGATAEIEITHLVRRSIRIVGSYGARTRQDMPNILRLASLGMLKPAATVTRRFPLEDADAAYRALDRGEIVGRALILPALEAEETTQEAES